MSGAKRGAWKTLLITTVVTTAQAVWAQEATAPRPGGRDLTTNIINTVVFGLIGMSLAIIGFKAFDLLIKHDIEKEIFDNKNMAAAVLSGFVVLGVCIIIAATIASP